MAPKLIKNLKENWLLLSKMTWGILENFTRALKVSKLGLWWDSFSQSRKRMSLKFTGELFVMECRIGGGIDLSFQNWHEEFDKFWPEQSNVSKICTSLGFFWPKYIMFELINYRGVIFHDTQEWCKIWRKTELWFGKWHEEFGKFSQAEKIAISF